MLICQTYGVCTPAVRGVYYDISSQLQLTQGTTKRLVKSRGFYRRISRFDAVDASQSARFCVPTPLFLHKFWLEDTFRRLCDRASRDTRPRLSGLGGRGRRSHIYARQVSCRRPAVSHFVLQVSLCSCLFKCKDSLSLPCCIATQSFPLGPLWLSTLIFCSVPAFARLITRNANKYDDKPARGSPSVWRWSARQSYSQSRW